MHRRKMNARSRTFIRDDPIERPTPPVLKEP
jgi:hypothetical protein